MRLLKNQHLSLPNSQSSTVALVQKRIAAVRLL